MDAKEFKMLHLTYDDSWNEFLKESYSWDEMELWHSRRDIGYSNQYDNRRQSALRAIEALTPAGGAVLDVAGASGNFTLPLAEKGYRVTWNDLRSECAELVQRKYEYGEVEFAPGNIFELATGWAERFDAVLAAEVIEHMAHPDEFLNCLASMTKPGGCIVVTTPNGMYFRYHYPRFSECADPSVYESKQFKPDGDGHIFLLDDADCRTLASGAGLAVERIDLINNPLTRGHVKLGHLLPYLPGSLVAAIESGTRKLPRFLHQKIHCQMIAVLRKPQA